MCVRERLFLKSHMFALCVWPPTSIAWNEGSFCSPLRPVFTGGGGILLHTMRVGALLLQIRTAKQGYKDTAYQPSLGRR